MSRTESTDPRAAPFVQPPIADYALLSNCRGSALVSRDGSIDWACIPDFDTPAVFSRLLGPDAGHWSVHPAATDAETTVTRTYLLGTMVVETTFATHTGTAVLTDALELERDTDPDGIQIGHHPPPVILRRVACTEGHVDLESRFAPVVEYGMTEPMLYPAAGGVRSHGGLHDVVLSAPGITFDITGGSATAFPRLHAGDQIALAAEVASPWDACLPLDADTIGARLDATIDTWQQWSKAHLDGYDGAYAAEVARSSLVLQALQYGVTGAIIAAPTMALPETVGGVRNWDYRYCWVRDASLTVAALAATEHHRKAWGLFRFLCAAASGHMDSDHSLQILYGIRGERLVHERTLAHLDGYRGSTPVRLGNGAWDQTQLDIYGELFDAAHILHEQQGVLLIDVTKAFLRGCADLAAERWTQLDAGIWEVRGGPRHFTYSKLMCWLAVDTAARLALPLSASEDEVARWTAAAADIRAAILDEAWSDSAGAYAQSFGSDTLDASVLQMPIVGFLPADDERMRATIEAIAADLVDERGFVYRYLADDGLPGHEGSFGVCTYWLVTCLAMAGEVDRAKTLFERMTACANDLGLMSEEIAGDGTMLGNFPQAFTHVGLVIAALAIDEAAKTGTAPPATPD